MNYLEVLNKVKAYEEKWGTLGTGKIMDGKDTLEHSTKFNRKDNKTMLTPNSEYYEFRKKVLAGKERNKLAHSATISPEELNERYFADMMEGNKLIHAQSKLYGQRKDNAKYYKREGQPGNYRYYYTKEEWDNRGANNTHSNAQDQAKADASERWHYEMKDKRLTSEANFVRKLEADKKGEQMVKDQKLVDTLKKDISNGVGKMLHDNNNPYGAVMKTLKRAFKNGDVRMDKDGRLTGNQEVIDAIYKGSDEAKKWGKNFSKNLGEDGSKKMLDEINKQSEEIVKTLGKGFEYNDKIKDIKEPKEAANVLTESDEWKKYDKEIRKLIKDGYLRANKDGSGFDRTNKLSKEKIDEIDDIVDKLDEFIEIACHDNRNISENDVWKALNDIIINTAVNSSILNYEKGKSDNYNTGDKKFVKHSSPEDNTATYTGNYGDEIVDEYKAFMEKVKAGRERNRLAHSAVISPEELNQRYLKDMADHSILCHASQNYKYYNKIDLPNGSTRYFYTKAEWDAYQEGKKRTEYDKQQKAKKEAGGAKAENDIESYKRNLYESNKKEKELNKNIDEDLNKKYNKANEDEDFLWKSSWAAYENGDNELYIKVHEAYDEALAEADGQEVKNGENPFYGSSGMTNRNKLLEKDNNDKSFHVKVVDAWKNKLAKEDLDELEKILKKTKNNVEYEKNKAAAGHEGDRYIDENRNTEKANKRFEEIYNENKDKNKDGYPLTETFSSKKAKLIDKYPNYNTLIRISNKDVIDALKKYLEGGRTYEDEKELKKKFNNDKTLEAVFNACELSNQKERFMGVETAGKTPEEIDKEIKERNKKK